MTLPPRGCSGLRLPGRAVDLDELREAGQPIMQRRGDRVRYGANPSVVIWNLHARRGVAKPFDEGIRGGLVALAHRDIQNQFGVALDCHEHVAIAQSSDRLRAARAFASCR